MKYDSKIASLPPLMTVVDVAELLRIAPQTVRRLAKTGQIRAAKSGNKWLFDRDSLLEQLMLDDYEVSDAGPLEMFLCMELDWNTEEPQLSDTKKLALLVANVLGPKRLMRDAR